jgi:hypothetical protein
MTTCFLPISSCLHALALIRVPQAYLRLLPKFNSSLIDSNSHAWANILWEYPDRSFIDGLLCHVIDYGADIRFTEDRDLALTSRSLKPAERFSGTVTAAVTKELSKNCPLR